MSELETSYSEIILDKIKLGFQYPASHIYLRNMNIEEFVDRVSDSFVYLITGYVMGKKLPATNHSVTFTTYATLWQAIKASWFPTLSRWARREPVMKTWTKTLTIDHTALWPEADVELPEEFGPVSGDEG